MTTQPDDETAQLLKERTVFHCLRYRAGNPVCSTYLNYTYDNIGQLKSAQGMEHGYDPNTGNPVDTPRLQEQFGYAYDKAWNLQFRTNNAMVETFGVNSLNELTNFSRSGTLTVGGIATEPSGNAPRNAYPGVSSVTVNGQAAVVYGDGSFAAAGLTPADGWNSYTAIAQDNVWPNGGGTLTP